jgi:hypothetical protein
MTTKFWLLDRPDDQPYAQWVDRSYKRITCPEAPGSLWSGRGIGGSTVRVDPRGLKGFTWTSDHVPLISRKMLQLFAEQAVTGFEAKPIKVLFPEDIELSPPPDLYQLVVTGWGGLAAPAAGMSLIRSCSVCGLRNYSIEDPSQLIDPAAWDGSDLFFVWPFPQYFFASDRLADILRREKVSGLELIPAPDIRLKKGETVGGPRFLSDYMAADRARELDQRFGVSNWLFDPGRPNSH